MKLSNQELDFERLKKAIKKTDNALEKYARSWQAILVDEGLKITNLEVLLTALEVNYPALNLKAAEQLSKKLKKETRMPILSDGACVSPLGTLKMRKTEIKKRLKKQGLTYQAKLSEQTTDILIGHRLKKEALNWLLDNHQHYNLLTEAMFLEVWAETEDSYLLGDDLSDTKVKQLKDLLWHEDMTNVSLALNMLESGGLSKPLMTTVFLLYKFHEDDQIVKKSEDLLKIYGSSDLLLSLRKLKKNWWSSEYEKWVGQAGLANWEIYQYEYLKAGLKLSLFQKAMNSSPQKEQIRFLQKAMESWSWGIELEAMQLPEDFDLETHAKLVYDCTHLKKLQIQPGYSNRLSHLPKGISALQQLEELSIDTALKEFPKELEQLPKLKYLKINMASMGVPDRAFEKGFGALERIEFTYYRYKKLPESVAALKNLETIRIPSGDLEVLPAALRQLPKLKELNLNNNKLRQLPDVLYLLDQLERLDICGYWMRWQADEIKMLEAALPDCEINA